MKSNQISLFGKLRHLSLPGVVLLAMATAFTGCEKSSAPAAATPPPVAPTEEQIVTVYIWDKYLSPDLMAEFKERTGIEVVPQLYESTDEMVEGLKSEPGTYDVFLCEDGYIQILAGKRLIKELDQSKLKNFANIDEPYRNPAFDPENQFTIPYLWGTTLLAYRKDKIPNPRQSWSIMSDPQYSGKVSFLNARMECYDVMLRTMGVVLKDADVAQVTQAAEMMLGLVRDRGLRFGSDNEVKDHLLQGDSWMSMIYSGDAALIAEENPEVPIGYFIPEEGAILWTDSFCISRDSRRVENAYKFLDFMLEAKSAAQSANEFHFASPNKAARPFLAKELLEDAAIYPRQDILDKCQYFALRSVDSLKEINIGWGRVQEAWLARSGQVFNEEATPAGPGAAPQAAPLPN